jgi:hypothetical protein
VRAADIDGDAITSLNANFSGLPTGNNAVFTPGPGDSTGTLTWTPGYTHAGTYSVTFTAANALSASASTVITVSNTDRPRHRGERSVSAAGRSPVTVVYATDVDETAFAERGSLRPAPGAMRCSRPAPATTGISPGPRPTTTRLLPSPSPPPTRSRARPPPRSP